MALWCPNPVSVCLAPQQQAERTELAQRAEAAEAAAEKQRAAASELRRVLDALRWVGCGRGLK